MNNSFEKYQKRRLRSAYFSVIISIALVLFMIGSLGLLILNAKKVSDHFKEQVTLTLFLKNSVTNTQIKSFVKSLKKASYTKQVIFISKEKAAKQHAKEIGEDFVKFLGYNPLYNSIDLRLKANFVTQKKTTKIVKQLAKNNFVKEINYDRPLIKLLSENIKRISFWILIISGFFTFIAILLINNSMRLTVYSKRFTIKTMQMVGATKHFIRKPFILKSMKLGFFGAIIALVGLAIVVYYINFYFPQIGLLNNYMALGSIFLGIVVLSLLLTALSTYFATQRYLNLHTDELYF